MFCRSTLFLAAVAGVTSAGFVNVTNKCDQEIYPAFNPPVRLVNDDATIGDATGGFPLASNATSTVFLTGGYDGTIWGRTGCDSSGLCATGQCLVGVNCTAPIWMGLTNGTAHATSALFNIGGYANTDYYYVSTVDGYNVPLTIKPDPTFCVTGPFSCTSKGVGDGCNERKMCHYGTNYTVQFC